MNTCKRTAIHTVIVQHKWVKKGVQLQFGTCFVSSYRTGVWQQDLSFQDVRQRSRDSRPLHWGHHRPVSTFYSDKLPLVVPRRLPLSTHNSWMFLRQALCPSPLPRVAKPKYFSCGVMARFTGAGNVSVCDVTRCRGTYLVRTRTTQLTPRQPCMRYRSTFKTLQNRYDCKAFSTLHKGAPRTKLACMPCIGKY